MILLPRRTFLQSHVDQLIIEQFALFDPAREFEADAVKPNNKKTASNRSVTWLFLIYAIILIAMSVRFWTLLYTPTIAFLLGYMGLREVIRMQEVRSRTIQANGLVGKESQFYIDSDTVWIGKTQIVNRHALSDISKVHYGVNFVGLQSHENVMFILPKRSIGNDSEVYRFMAQVSVKLQNTVQIETDNPYQPPSN